MGYSLHFLNAAQDFKDEDIESIKTSTFSALEEINKFLPPIDLDIVFWHAPTQTIRDEYMGGRAVSASLIYIYFDASYSDLKRIIQDELKKTLAHEYHHSCRMKALGYSWNTLGESLVSEGLADSFDHEVFNGAVPRWCRALDADQMQTYLAKAAPKLHAENYNHPQWFFGADNVLPPWTGYTLGYFIIQSYLAKNPQMTAAKLVDTPPAEILQILTDLLPPPPNLGKKTFTPS
jgi:uncharacterized protein YjaZ